MEFTETPKYDELKKILAELKFEQETKEYKMFEAIINALGEIESDVSTNSLMMSEIDEDLADIEDEIYEDLDIDFGEKVEDTEVFELDCPHCKVKLYIDESILLQDKMNCPNCGKEVEFDLDEGCGGCCGSCHGCE